MNLCGIETVCTARNRRTEDLTDYAKSCVRQMKQATDALEHLLETGALR